ncbi:MAG TPA: hypothetical protein VME86_04365 [Acidobacteriaceae bacterium]|nr:hypothetical protein [Acidobacteriaceae bacterium]
MDMTTLSANLEILSKGQQADFADSEIDAKILRSFILGLPPYRGPACRCSIKNAVFREKLDLSDGRLPDGSPLPALEFHECTFQQGFCADGARLERLKFFCCKFKAQENNTNVPWPHPDPCDCTSVEDQKRKRCHRPANCISLRHCQIATELRFESLAPNDYDGKPGVLTVDAFAIRIGTNIQMNDTCLRAQQGESLDISDDPHYALNLATASVRGDVQLMPNVDLEGGLKMRDAQVGGTFWGNGLHVTDGEDLASRNELSAKGYEPRLAFWLATTDIKGNLMLGSHRNRLFRSEGAASLRNATTGGDLYLSGEIKDSLNLSGATVKGRLSAEGELWTFSASQLAVEGDLTIACRQMRTCYLSGAKIAGTLDVRGSEFVKSAPKARAVTESRKLQCYKDMLFREVLVFVDSLRPLYIASFLIPETNGAAPILLDGSSYPLHELNKKAGTLTLDKEEQVREYLKLFCASVWGDLGSFAIIDEHEFLPKERKKLKDEETILKIPVTKQGDEWQARAYVRYGGHLFQAKFEIPKTGLIKMKSDEPLDPWSGSDQDGKQRVEYYKPYRIPPQELGRYNSDFLGRSPSFQPIGISISRHEVSGWINSNPNCWFSPAAYLTAASCKQIEDWRVSVTGLDSKAITLVWPPATLLQEFNYRQLPREDSDWEEARKLRLKWVNKSAGPRESVKIAAGRAAKTFSLIALLLLCSFSLAIWWPWPWPPMSAFTDDSSGHLAWHIVVVLSILIAFLLRQLRRKHWKPETGTFVGQPYAHLSMVLRERGEDNSARDVEAEKIWQEAVHRGRSNFRQWLAQCLWWRPYGLLFDFGLSPWRAFVTMFTFLCLGWAATFVLSSNGMLRVNIARVASEVSITGNRPVQLVVAKGPDIRVANYSCKEEIEPSLYAFELMTPLLNLHQESLCEIRSKPKVQGKTPPIDLPLIGSSHLPAIFSYGWLWEYAKSIYMLLGSIITSLAFLTFSGIARRWER